MSDATSVKEAPIVLIHGIKGSNLAQTYDDSFDTIWSGIQHRFESILDLEFNDKGDVERDPWDLMTVTKIEQLAYGELLGRLRKQFPETPSYIFRYDWRRDVLETAKQLGQFLDLVRRKTDQPLVRIVTHSMGGLILSAFLKLKPSEHLRKIQRAVMAAPPFWGSIESMRTLTIGETALLGFNAPEVYRKISRTFPSVYQLVPGYEGAWVHPESGASIWDIQSWQRRVKFGTRKQAVYEEKDSLMQRHLSRAKQFHETDLINFDALPAPERDKFLLLYGTGERTRATLNVRPTNSEADVQFFFDFDHEGNWNTEGDGTVPVKSALRYAALRRIEVSLADCSAWWPWLWDDKAKIRIAGFHGMFLGIDKVQGIVCDWFKGRNPKPSWVEPIRP